MCEIGGTSGVWVGSGVTFVMFKARLFQYVPRAHAVIFIARGLGAEKMFQYSVVACSKSFTAR